MTSTPPATSDTSPHYQPPADPPAAYRCRLCGKLAAIGIRPCDHCKVSAWTPVSLWALTGRDT